MRSIAFVLLACACVTPRPAVRERLPGPEADAWDACAPIVFDRVCAHGDPDPFAVGEGACLKGLADRYVVLAATADRRAYLVELGCPTPVVRQHLP